VIGIARTPNPGSSVSKAIEFLVAALRDSTALLMILIFAVLVPVRVMFRLQFSGPTTFRESAAEAAQRKSWRGASQER
jgi:hypothetical protein